MAVWSTGQRSPLRAVRFVEDDAPPSLLLGVGRGVQYPHPCPQPVDIQERFRRSGEDPLRAVPRRPFARGPAGGVGGRPHGPFVCALPGRAPDRPHGQSAVADGERTPFIGAGYACWSSSGRRGPFRPCADRARGLRSIGSRIRKAGTGRLHDLDRSRGCLDRRTLGKEGFAPSRRHDLRFRGVGQRAVESGAAGLEQHTRGVRQGQRARRAPSGSQVCGRSRSSLGR